MGYDDGEFSGRQNQWITSTYAIRDDIRTVRDEISRAQERCPPYHVPGEVDWLNRLVHDYASQLRPKKDVFPDLWGEEIDHMTIPKGGSTIEAGNADEYGDLPQAPLSQLPRERTTISLAELKNWRKEGFVQYKVEYVDPAAGTVTETRHEDLYLTPLVVDTVVEQLDRCLNSLGWMPSEELQDYVVSPEEAI